MRFILLWAALGVACLSTYAAAEQPPPFQDFSAKRIKPPKAGSARRITVQIAPRAEPAIPPRPDAAVPVSAVAARPNAGAGQEAVGRYAWFWTHVSADQSDAGAARLDHALDALGRGPGGAVVSAPRLQSLQEMAEAHGRDILGATVGTRVSPALALAVMAVESAGKSDAVSSAGAQGLMQLMPDTATRFGVQDSLDATQNIRGGVAFLDFLLEKFDNDPVLTLAGYNAGENSIGRNGGVPPYPETRDYVPKVLAAYQLARGLCMTPPELITDGCVFQVQAVRN